MGLEPAILQSQGGRALPTALRDGRGGWVWSPQNNYMIREVLPQILILLELGFPAVKCLAIVVGMELGPLDFGSQQILA